MERGPGDARPARRRTAHLDPRPRRAALACFALLLVTLPSLAVQARAQEADWTGRLLVRGFSVRDADDWLLLRQEASRAFADGTRLRVGLAQTRRFGAWDASAGAGATLRPADRVSLSVDGRVTPAADVLEDARLETRASLQAGPFVPSLGYRVQLYGEGTVHTVSPRVVWYGGPWRLSGEVRVIRSALETVNLAAIGRATRRLSARWSAWLGLASGEEDYLVGAPPTAALRTLTTRSAFGGVERTLTGGWSLRFTLTGIESDPRLDRVGGSVTVARAF